MNLKHLVTAAAIATLAATAAQAQMQTQPSPQPDQRMQRGNSMTAPNAKHGTGSASGTVGSSRPSSGRAGKTVKPAPEGAMEHDGPAAGSGTGTGTNGMSR